MMILLFLYGIEVLKYYLMYDVCFEEKIKRYWVPILGGGIYSAVLLAGGIGDDLSLRLAMYTIAIISVVFAKILDGGRGLPRIAIVIFMISCLEEMCLLFGNLLVEKKR